MKRKSQLAYSLLFQLLLITIIFLSLLNATNKIRDKEFFNQKTISKNIAFLYDATMSSPGKTEVSFQLHPDHETNIDILDNCVVRAYRIGKSTSTFNCALNTRSDTNCKTKVNCDYKKDFIGFKNE